MIIDQTSWGHIRITGEDRVRFLQGMCTTNVDTLAEGGCARAAMLNTKGRVMSIFEVVKRGDHLLLICEPTLTDKTIELLSKYAIMDDVEFANIDVAVHRVWDSPSAVWDAPPVFAPPPEPAADPDAVEVRRVEAGLPTYGVDIGEDNFPFDTLLARYVDYEKGCYLGQEPVSRVYFRGQPNKAMRGLRVSGESPVAPGAPVTHPERANAGAVTSSVVSPTFGPIALAYLHRSVFDPGNQVEVAGRQATVAELPFTA